MIYATHGSKRFNRWLHGYLASIAADLTLALGENMIGLVLGGGFGRGEGSLVRLNNVEVPYSALHFTLVVQRKGPVKPRLLEPIREKYEPLVKTMIHFHPPLTVRDIRHWSHTLKWQDLLRGHIVLAGPHDLLTMHAPRSLREKLPIEESSRLLLKRGVGLLWAIRVAYEVVSSPGPEFVRRHFYHAAQALGDALLIAQGRYATPYSGRIKRLSGLIGDIPELASLRPERLYEESIRFRFRPDRTSRKPVNLARLEHLAERWGKVLLYVENLRTGNHWPSLLEYAEAAYTGPLDQHEPTEWIRSLLRRSHPEIITHTYTSERLNCELPLLLGLAGNAFYDENSQTTQFNDLWGRSR